jgi:hypothetical protein
MTKRLHNQILVPLLPFIIVMLLVLAQVTAQAPVRETSLTSAQFARLSEEMSEAGGYFDTDNLISNESSYLHVIGRMREMKTSGGAFIGVGPDQSFSYIAQIRPHIAFMVDIRRDNLLQHLFYKSLFGAAQNRIEFLCLLFGKPVPENSPGWNGRPIGELASYIDKAPAKRELLDGSWRTIRDSLAAMNVKLSTDDLATIRRIHSDFFRDGINLKFTSHNRAPQSYYPSYRDLILEKDLTGRQASFLAREEDFQFLKSLEGRNMVIPLVGNLAGEKALKSIATYLRDHGEVVSALYTSNVEFYLMRGAEFQQYARNVATLPRTGQSLIIRSYFNNSWGRNHPQSVPGYYSTQLLQTIDSFAREFNAGGYRSYSDVIGRNFLDLK